LIGHFSSVAHVSGKADDRIFVKMLSQMYLQTRKTLLNYGPQNPAYRCAEISGDPIQSVCSQGVLAVPLLASILRSWHRDSWN